MKSLTAAAMIAQSLVGESFEHGVAHLLRALDAHDVDRRRPRRARGRARPSMTSVTSAPRRVRDLGQRVTLMTRGAIRDDAHRVDRFAGAAGTDEQTRARSSGPR